jgi:hypothetical protein
MQGDSGIGQAAFATARSGAKKAVEKQPELTAALHLLGAAEALGLAKDGGKNVKMKGGNEKDVLPLSTAEYNSCGWRTWLNNTTLTLGMQNVFDTDPPFAAGAAGNNYDNSLATIKGRFWYVQLKKRF